MLQGVLPGVLAFALLSSPVGASAAPLYVKKPGVLEGKPITAHQHSAPGGMVGLGYLGELVDELAPWRSGLRLRGEYLSSGPFNRFGAALTYGYLPPFRLRQIEVDRARASRHSISVLALYRPGLWRGTRRLSGYVGVGQQLELWRWRTAETRQLRPDGRLLVETGLSVALGGGWHFQANLQGALSYVPPAFSGCPAGEGECATSERETLMQPFRVRAAVEIGFAVFFGGWGYH